MRRCARLVGVPLAILLAIGSLATSAIAKQKKDNPKTRLLEGTVRLVPTGDEPTSVAGLGSYLGPIELTPATDGIVVANRLPLERYLLGLAEVPPDWPAQTLEAQAIAARTYALNTLARPPAGAAATYGFDICASVECQVFSGAEVLQQPDGHRWAEAVSATAGQAILYQGEPILARYHSVSGGRTFDNEQIFTSESSYPYLKGVSSPTEDASPLDRWGVIFTLKDLQRIIERRGLWTGGKGRLESVRSVASSEGFHYPDVLFSGTKGRARMTAEELRTIVRDLAPELFPGKYPSLTLTGRLPETFPSNRLVMSTVDGTVRVDGRGWGHGVGMSQWGAHGLALAGASAGEILGHYYTDVSLGRVEDPGTLDVGIDWGRVSLEVTGAFEIVDASGDTVVRASVGRWGFRWNAAGSLSVTPPRGSDRPLSVRLLRSPAAVEVGEAAFLTIALSRPARVTPITIDDETSDEPGTVRDAGRARVTWLAPLEPGSYSVHIEASSGSETERSEPVEITVTGATPDAGDQGVEAATEEKPDPPGAPWGLLLFALVFAALGVFAATSTIRK
ncbi:MAG: SpoIID/LytB domain-containing protein [Actinomycetota bacterium]